MRKFDGVRVDHEKKGDGVRVDHRLLLTASEMDPACEASLTVCGSYGRSGLP